PGMLPRGRRAIGDDDSQASAGEPAGGSGGAERCDAHARAGTAQHFGVAIAAAVERDAERFANGSPRAVAITGLAKSTPIETDPASRRRGFGAWGVRLDRVPRSLRDRAAARLRRDEDTVAERPWHPM